MAADHATAEPSPDQFALGGMPHAADAPFGPRDHGSTPRGGKRGNRDEATATPFVSAPDRKDMFNSHGLRGAGVPAGRSGNASSRKIMINNCFRAEFCCCCASEAGQLRVAPAPCGHLCPDRRHCRLIWISVHWVHPWLDRAVGPAPAGRSVTAGRGPDASSLWRKPGCGGSTRPRLTGVKQ